MIRESAELNIYIKKGSKLINELAPLNLMILLFCIPF